VKPFGGPRLLLETIRERGEVAIAGATTRPDRQPCLPASTTIPLQIERGRIYEPHAPEAIDGTDPPGAAAIERHDLLGGLIHEYRTAA
jgi:hypothetical protein